MKTLSIVLLLSLILCQPVQAKQRYNAFENSWETTSDCEDTLKYNAFENEWSYEMKDSTLEYNSYNNSYDWSMDCEGEDYNAF